MESVLLITMVMKAVYRYCVKKMYWKPFLGFLVCCTVSMESTSNATVVNSGISYEEDRSIRPLGPSGLKIEPVGNKVVISWNPVGLEIITQYRVFRKKNEENFLQIAVVEANPQMELYKHKRYSYDDRSLSEAGLYTYTLTAVDHYGNESDLLKTIKIRIKP